MKKYTNESVVQDWVCTLPFMQQALLMTAMRGPDGLPKYNTTKNIVRYIRGAVLKPAGQITGNDNTFMWINYGVFDQFRKEFYNSVDEYPIHFYMHLVHAAEVIAYGHPSLLISRAWYMFYAEACSGFHMNPESREEMYKRLSI